MTIEQTRRRAFPNIASPAELAQRALDAGSLPRCAPVVTWGELQPRRTIRDATSALWYVELVHHSPDGTRVRMHRVFGSSTFVGLVPREAAVQVVDHAHETPDLAHARPWRLLSDPTVSLPRLAGHLLTFHGISLGIVERLSPELKALHAEDHEHPIGNGWTPHLHVEMRRSK